jgi:Cof subfamily protein (haloacid dehalogenase superfamily)
MELVVFDLDGTLLNNYSQISDFTRETLTMMSANGIAYTVATGRNLHSAQEIIAGHGFTLPHVYTNGVIIWDPRVESLALGNFLSVAEADLVLRAAAAAGITPFVHSVTSDHRHFVFHPPVRSHIEERLLANFKARSGAPVLPLEQMPANAQITNISMIGAADRVESVERIVDSASHLVAYAGPSIEAPDLKWADIHHSNASKGVAVAALREQLGITRVMCFGDSDNDLSMFDVADECYAPANAKEHVKAVATDVIGHHNEDGVARYIRERFNL